MKKIYFILLSLFTSYAIFAQQKINEIPHNTLSPHILTWDANVSLSGIGFQYEYAKADSKTTFGSLFSVLLWNKKNYENGFKVKPFLRRYKAPVGKEKINFYTQLSTSIQHLERINSNSEIPNDIILDVGVLIGGGCQFIIFNNPHLMIDVGLDVGLLGNKFIKKENKFVKDPSVPFRLDGIIGLSYRF